MFSIGFFPIEISAERMPSVMQNARILQLNKSGRSGAHRILAGILAFVLILQCIVLQFATICWRRENTLRLWWNNGRAKWTACRWNALAMATC